MLFITRGGLVDAERIKTKIFPNIERGALGAVNGIVVHQTGGPTADSAFGAYRQKGAVGAHFMIDKDGTIYQTASVYKITNHVGLMQSRCVNTQRCAPAEFKRMSALEKAWKPKEISRIETGKAWPDRYPINADSIGIEIVGKAQKINPTDQYATYEAVNEPQNASLKWLVKELAETLGVAMTEVHRHPDIARKTPTEARTAQW